MSLREGNCGNNRKTQAEDQHTLGNKLNFILSYTCSYTYTCTYLYLSTLKVVNYIHMSPNLQINSTIPRKNSTLFVIIEN